MNTIYQTLGISDAELAAREADELSRTPKPDDFEKLETDAQKLRERLDAIESKRAAALQLGAEYQRRCQDIAETRGAIKRARDSAVLLRGYW